MWAPPFFQVPIITIGAPGGERRNQEILTFPGFIFEDMSLTSSLGEVSLFFGAISFSTLLGVKLLSRTAAKGRHP